MRHSIPTGQWLPARDGGRWWFDTGSVALDFAYTGEFGERELGAGWESIHGPSELGVWLGERFTEVDGTVSDGDLRDARALRSALARLATAASDNAALPQGDVDTLNLYASIPDIPPALPGGSRQSGRRAAKASQALAAIARDAVDLFGGDNQERIRQCAADDCGLIFYDESRSNNRRWCSMQRCGNRAKVRAHRERQQ